MRETWQWLLVWLGRGSVVAVEALDRANAYGAEKETARVTVTDLLILQQSVTEHWMDIASKHLGQLHEIAGYVTRRPPRRRWLKLSRKIAREATR